jgi:hypothetical protein
VERTKEEATPEKQQLPVEAKTSASTSKKALIGAGVGLVLLAVTYGVGRYQGAQTAGAADHRAEAADGERAKTEATLSSERARATQLEARRRLHLALMALDARNFGIAQEHVTEAGKLIQKSAPAKDSELAKLGDELATTRLVATEDLGSQRSKLLAWTQRFDSALPPAKP